MEETLEHRIKSELLEKELETKASCVSMTGPSKNLDIKVWVNSLVGHTFLHVVTHQA